MLGRGGCRNRSPPVAWCAATSPISATEIGAARAKKGIRETKKPATSGVVLARYLANPNERKTVVKVGTHTHDVDGVANLEAC